MKSFRVYLREPDFHPARVVADYTADEVARFQQAFVPIADRYRRHMRVARCAGFALMGCFALGVILPKTGFPWFVIPAGICALVCFGSWLSSPKLRCPGCTGDAEEDFGRYCPECGSDHFQKGGWFPLAHCTACGRYMNLDNPRGYKIRACPYCGLMLDGKGL